MLLDATGDITIDAGGGDIILSDDAAIFGTISSSGGMQIRSRVNNADMFLRGVDNGTEFNALTLDMSEGGNATFAGSINMTDNKPINYGGQTMFTHTGSVTRIGDNTSSSVLSIGGGVSTFTGLVTGIAPVADLNFATKKYVDDSITGGASYLGVWDPDVSLNSGFGNPSLDGGAADTGDYYVCSADGAATPNGTGNEPNSWETGDWVIWNEDLGTGGLWQKIDNTTVLSGNGTAGTIPVWTNDETIGDSTITTSGNDVTFAGDINLTTPPGAQNSTFDLSCLDTNLGAYAPMQIISGGMGIVSSNSTGLFQNQQWQSNGNSIFPFYKVGFGTALPAADIISQETKYARSRDVFPQAVASQSGTTITSISAIFTADMVGKKFVWLTSAFPVEANGVMVPDNSTTTFISAFVSSTVLTATTSQTVAQQTWEIFTPGVYTTNRTDSKISPQLAIGLSLIHI